MYEIESGEIFGGMGRERRGGRERVISSVRGRGDREI
jgi:hypothetical protein